MLQAGLALRDEYVVAGDFYRPSGTAAAQRLLALDEPPTAVFAASDEMAVGALLAARAAGLRVPQDLAIVGFDDIEIAAVVDPALTTVAQDKPGFGVAAAKAIMAMITGSGQEQPAILPTRLVVRGSCGG
jgi:LacI family transcriptional regulator